MFRYGQLSWHKKPRSSTQRSSDSLRPPTTKKSMLLTDLRSRLTSSKRTTNCVQASEIDTTFLCTEAAESMLETWPLAPNATVSVPAGPSVRAQKLTPA